MKIRFLILIFLFISINQVDAQRHCLLDEKSREELKAQKVAFLTTKLNLTVEEAQKFWPLYNEFEQKHFEVMSQRHEIMRKLRPGAEPLSDKEAEEILDKLILLEMTEAELHKTYVEKYKKFLSAQKILLLHKAERQFKHQLLRNMKKGNGQPPPPPRH